MFNSEKVLQEIGFLLGLNDRRMPLLKLMKELYLIDRLSIEERDTSVSGDVFFSMDHGPILSYSLNMLRDITVNYWGNHLEAIKTRNHYPDIFLSRDVDKDLLSKKDLKYISEISAKFKDYNAEQIEEYTHDLPEWDNPRGSSKKIKFASVMRALGKTEKDISDAKHEYEFLEMLSDLGRN